MSLNKVKILIEKFRLDILNLRKNALNGNTRSPGSTTDFSQLPICFLVELVLHHSPPSPKF